MPRMTEQDLRAVMRDPRYWTAGHPEREAYGAWVGEGWSTLVPAQQKAGGDGRTVEV